jgi:hypothetical protein
MAKTVKKVTKTVKKSTKVSEKLNVEVKKPNVQRVELWAYDEYNQGSIVGSGTDIEKLFSQAENYVTSINVDNSLAGGEQEKSWEAHFPVFTKKGKVDTSRIYAGNKRDSKHYVYEEVDGKWVQSVLKPTKDIRFFLGNVRRGSTVTRWYLADHKGNEIDSVSNDLLDRKTVLFLRFV